MLLAVFNRYELHCDTYITTPQQQYQCSVSAQCQHIQLQLLVQFLSGSSSSNTDSSNIVLLLLIAAAVREHCSSERYNRQC
jgi:hypothetical protein